MQARGFTLVEVLVALAVGAILLAIAVPGYSSLMNANRLTSVTNDLVSSIHLTRSEAIKRGMRVTLCKTSNPAAPMPACNAAAGWEQGWLVFVDGGVRGVIDSNDLLLWVHEAVPGDTTITTHNYRNFLSYLPGGGSQGSNGLANDTIVICVMGYRRDILINTTGRPRLRKGTC